MQDHKQLLSLTGVRKSLKGVARDLPPGPPPLPKGICWSLGLYYTIEKSHNHYQPERAY